MKPEERDEIRSIAREILLKEGIELDDLPPDKTLLTVYREYLEKLERLKMLDKYK